MIARLPKGSGDKKKPFSGQQCGEGFIVLKKSIRYLYTHLNLKTNFGRCVSC